ncbi:MANSC domain-containing protein 4-like isoform X3 [Polypterus senegalus]|uniref:MANSC domain-containing protein 4-like isoform X3 n=1 Tax=Polypterus senegalus TaxID=55291 RepID=UPI001964C669|nr:MANSC domain-containing protein 4-like isoform X3 [Polypterus senegalus]
MTLLWRLFLTLGFFSRTEMRCSPMTFYKSCWIRRYPGIFVDVTESLEKGAQILRIYYEDTAQKCSRACCLSWNGIDPDLLVFGKHSTSSLRMWTNLSSSKHNDSDSLSSEKRQFHRPPFSTLMRSTFTTALHKYDKSIHNTLESTTSSPSFLKSNITIWSTFYSVESHRKNLDQNTEAFFSGVNISTQRSTSVPITAASKFTPKTWPQLTTALMTTRPYSNLAFPAYLDNSKHYPNETKGYINRNYTSEDKPKLSFWGIANYLMLVPLVIFSTVFILCFCIVMFIVSHCIRKRGHYKPVWKPERSTMYLVKYVIVNESL